MVSKLTIEQSDLFFNLQKPNYDSLRIDVTEDATEQIRAEIDKDAVEAVGSYPRTFAGLTAQDLADDFMRRL